MVWLQNGISMLICFLIARMLMDHQILDRWIFHVLGREIRGKALSPDLFFLLISYVLSLFFSNTVVVLSLLPLLKLLILDGEQDSPKVTRLGLAIVYGANIGGMGSLVGSPINLAAATYLQHLGVPGADRVTFFSWLLLGMPVSLVLLCCAWLVIRKGRRVFPEPVQRPVSLSKNKRKALLGSVLVLFLLFIVSALQFILMPGPICMGLNIIDLFFLLLLPVVLGLFLFWPLKGRLGAGLIHNLRFFIGSLLFLPMIALHQIVLRRPFGTQLSLERGRIGLENRMALGWRKRFDRSCRELGAPCGPQSANPFSLVSLNRLFFDLPYLGFLLLGLVLGVLYLFALVGDNPATAVTDGWLVSWIDQAMNGLSGMISGVVILLLLFIALTVFLTELFNNTVVLFIAGPLLMQSPLIEPNLQLPAFLILTLAASAAFMSPVATPVNAIVSTGLPGFSLSVMMARGFWLNLMSIGWLMAVMLLLSRYF